MSIFNSTLTRDRLKSTLRYNRDTGDFTRISATRGNKIGSKAGQLTVYGYVVIMIDKVNYNAHRLAWFYEFGEWPSKFIDHIDGDKANNRVSNLREATKIENGQNRRFARKDSASGVIGVRKHGKHGWRAIICVNKKTIHLGTFTSIDLASEAYISAKRSFHPFCTI